MKYIILIAALLVSCSTNAPKEQDVMSEKQSAVESSPEKVEELVKSFAVEKDGVVGIELKESGQVWAGGQVIGVLDGDSLKKADGTLIAAIKDGMIVNAEGQAIVSIDANGTIGKETGKVLSWSAEGHFMDGETDLGFVLKPNESEFYRSASFVLFLFLSVAPSTSSTTPS